MSHSKDLEQLATTGARLLVDALLANHVERVFCVPGESFLAVLDALADDTARIQTVVCRHEAAAANMAEAVGKLTGRPGIAFVTRGPGATHASIGVHTAFQDSTPMILFVGQCAREHLDREAFQEIDYRRMFGQMAKWVAQIDDPRRIPEYLSHAFHVATSGRPGPVVLALPEDVLSKRARRSRSCRPRNASRPRRRPRSSTSCASGSRAPSGRSRSSAAAAGHPTHARTCAPSSSAGSCRWPARSATRTRSTTRTRTTRATSGRNQPRAREAHPRRRSAARDRAAPRRSDDRRLHAARHPEDAPDADPRTRVRTSLAACMRPTCRSCRACPKSPRRSPRSSRPSTPRGPAPLPTRIVRIANGMRRCRCPATSSSAT